MNRYVYLDAGHGGVWTNFYIATSGAIQPGFVNSTVQGVGINDPGSPYYIPQAQRKNFQYQTARWFSRHQGNIITYGDSGNVSSYFNNVEEQYLTFKIANELRDALGNPYNVILTRPYDGYVHLQKRWSLANTYYNAATSGNSALRNQHIFVSIHCNSHPANSPNIGLDKGFEIYTRTVNDTLSTTLAQAISSSIQGYFVRDSVAFNKAELKQRNFLVLKHTKMPAILVEAAWLDNQDDAERIVSDAKRQALVKAIRDGIDSYFSYNRKPDDNVVLLGGYVVDRNSPGKFLGGIQVFAELDGLTRVVRTDAKGHFELSLPKLGNWNLIFTDPQKKYLKYEYHSLVINFKQQLNNILMLPDTTVVKPPIVTPPVDSNVSGAVNKSDGTPLDGVRVEFIDDSTQQSAGAVLTDNQGKYKFKIVKTAMYEIVYSKNGYIEVKISKQLNPATMFTFPVRTLIKK